MKSGETVDVEAEKVLSIIDDFGHVYRSDFVETSSKGMLKLNASIYNNAIDGWVKLPKTGHWIMHKDHRECSECHVYLLKDMPRNSYCPNCGTRMTESEDKS